LHTLSFNILPSPESNDHEVRILIDNNDLLGSDYLGLDPPAFFSQPNFDQNGELMIGRCSCGVEGCCDFPVTVAVDGNIVSWTDQNGLNLQFERKAYRNTIIAAQTDLSWEDAKRKVERLCTEILKESRTKDDFIFTWASARINDNQISLSYNRNGEQKLFLFDWDGEDDKSVLQNAARFLEQISHA
jgi:hypothetical protein